MAYGLLTCHHIIKHNHMTQQSTLSYDTAIKMQSHDSTIVIQSHDSTIINNQSFT